MSELQIKPYQVGLYYEVPTIDATLHGLRDIWPILGPWHEDAEFVKFPWEHFHLDGRFLNTRQWEWLHSRFETTDAVFGVVVTERGFSAYGELDGPRMIHGQPQIERRQCMRVLPDFPFERATWLFQLEKEFSSAVIRQPICPHRGIPLDGLTPKDGIVTCPGHGLCFDVLTGQCVSASKRVERKRAEVR